MSEEDSTSPGGSDESAIEALQRMLDEKERVKPLANFEIPDEVLDECPGAWAVQILGEVVIWCEDGGVWRRDAEGKWRRLEPLGPRHPVQDMADTKPKKPPPEPPPEPPPSGAGWKTCALVLVIVIAVVGAVLLAARLRSGPNRESATTSTTSAPSPGPASPSPDRTAGDSLTVPNETLDEAATALGIDRSAINDLQIAKDSPVWQSGGQSPAQGGPVMIGHGAKRIGSQDLYVIVLDRPVVDSGKEGAGTQLTVGRAPDGTAPPVAGTAGFAEGYDELFFVKSSGALEAVKPPKYTPLGFGNAFLSRNVAFVIAPAKDATVRFGNFYRETSGAKASADDPTGFQVSGTYKMMANGLVPAP